MLFRKDLSETPSSCFNQCQMKALVQRPHSHTNIRNAANAAEYLDNRHGGQYSANSISEMHCNTVENDGTILLVKFFHA